MDLMLLSLSIKVFEFEFSLSLSLFQMPHIPYCEELCLIKVDSMGRCNGIIKARTDQRLRPLKVMTVIRKMIRAENGAGV